VNLAILLCNCVTVSGKHGITFVVSNSIAIIKKQKMKKLKLILSGILLLVSVTIQSQFSFSFNFGTPPPWGPVGYSQVQYYYLPDVEAYYDIPSHMFIYFSGTTWVRRAALPSRYHDYDLYRGHKVVMPDYHGGTPYSHFKEHKMKYARGYHWNQQKTIGERPGKGNSGGNKPHEKKSYNQGGKSNDNGHNHNQEQKNNKGNKGNGKNNGNNKTKRSNH
jgi:hypothetical protein